MKPLHKLIPALLLCCAAGAVYAKLPPSPPVDPAKAADAKAKTAEADKKEAEALVKAQDRAVENFKRQKVGDASMAPAKSKPKPARKKK